MEQKNKEYTALSQKRYAIARCIKYAQLFLIILIFFLPTVRFTYKAETSRLEASSGFSVFQFIIGETETKIHLKADGRKISKDSLEGSLIGNLLETQIVDIPYDLFRGQKWAIWAFQILAIIDGLITGFRATANTGSLSFAKTYHHRPQKSSENAKNNNSKEKINLNFIICDQTYITHVYNSLPKGLEFLEKFLMGTIFATYITFGMAMLLPDTFNSSSGWTLQPIYPIIILILFFTFMRNGIIGAVCSKDIRLIRSTRARFQEDYHCPTIASDIKTISTLFQSFSTAEFASENARIQMLQKYKTLFDQGVITKEEYEAKKAELLNRKD